MRNLIMEALYESGQITTQEAQELLQTSESTVRRLFCRMSDDRSVIRIFGGISLPSTNNRYQYEKTIEKKTI